MLPASGVYGMYEKVVPAGSESPTLTSGIMILFCRLSNEELKDIYEGGIRYLVGTCAS